MLRRLGITGSTQAVGVQNSTGMVIRVPDLRQSNTRRRLGIQIDMTEKGKAMSQSKPIDRPAARLIVLNERDEVLLLRLEVKAGHYG